MTTTTNETINTLTNAGCNYWDGAGGRCYVNDLIAFAALAGWRVDEYGNVFDQTGKALSNKKAREVKHVANNVWFDVQAGEFRAKWRLDQLARDLLDDAAKAIA